MAPASDCGPASQPPPMRLGYSEFLKRGGRLCREMRIVATRRRRMATFHALVAAAATMVHVCTASAAGGRLFPRS